MSVTQVGGRSSFATELEAACDEFAALWRNTPADVPRIGVNPGFVRRLSNGRAAARLIDELAADLERLPDGEAERRAWRESVRSRLQDFGSKRLGWPDGYRRLLLGDHFYESAVAFARDARAIDPRLPLAHVGQALRNVWIGNSFQMLLDRPVRLRPGLFAYSMLYPVTDNWLDDPEVPDTAKRAFNERFAMWLAGTPATAEHERERTVAGLVRRIEAEFPRDRFPSVYDSLLAIHAAQVRSLAQQRIGVGADEVLDITLRKGGSSVLADLYLVADDPTPLEVRFAFGYGVCLQLLDDLQDVESDLAAGHETVFTRAARCGWLDDPTARLAASIDRVLLRSGRFDGPAFADRIDLIRRNCLALLVGSVAEHPARFTRRFRRALETQWPVTFRSYRRLKRRAAARFASLQPALRAAADAEAARPSGPIIPACAAAAAECS